MSKILQVTIPKQLIDKLLQEVKKRMREQAKGFDYAFSSMFEDDVDEELFELAKHVIESQM